MRTATSHRMAIGSVFVSSLVSVVAPPSTLAAPHFAGRWGPPAPPVVVNTFNPPAHDWLPGHRGVDLIAVPDEPIVAPAAGLVTFAGFVVDRPVVVFQHHDGLTSTFEPALAVPGTPALQGSPIGTVASGMNHCAPAMCLHWGVRDGTTYLDPMSYGTGLTAVLEPDR